MTVYYAVTVKGRPVGEAWRERTGWVWMRNNGGKDSWPKSGKRGDVAALVARVSRAHPFDVKFTPMPSL
jgi:hypothetical protein